MPASQKAYLETETGARIACLFNPNELSLSKSSSWKADTVPGKDAPELFFTGGNAGKMKLALTFDTTHEGKPVTTHTAKLLKLLDIDESLPGFDEAANNGRPPWVKFHWGDFHSFAAVTESVDLTFTYFSRTGVPLRAKADLSLSQYEPTGNWGPQNPTSRTPRPQRTHLFQSGETLDRVSARHYGDSTRWRSIAAANGISDPLRVAPGTLLTIPKLRG